MTDQRRKKKRVAKKKKKELKSRKHKNIKHYSSAKVETGIGYNINSVTFPDVDKNHHLGTVDNYKRLFSESEKYKGLTVNSLADRASLLSARTALDTSKLFSESEKYKGLTVNSLEDRASLLSARTALDTSKLFSESEKYKGLTVNSLADRASLISARSSLNSIKILNDDNDLFTSSVKILSNESNNFNLKNSSRELIFGVDKDSLSNFSSVNNDSYYRRISENIRTVSYGSDEILVNKNKIKKEKSELENEIDKLTLELQEERDDREQIVSELREKLKNIEKYNEILYLEKKIHPKAFNLVMESGEFLSKFTNNNNYQTTIVSMDIRRSTSLMLKAKSPKLYSEFIVALTDKLKNIIINNYGIFDKFTGDGILAYFPEFYSGEDHILHALRASEQCHQIFEEHYMEYRSMEMVS